MMYVELIKNFFSPIGANTWVLESFRPPEPKNVYSHFLDIMYVELIKIVFSPIGANRAVLDHLGLLSPKTFDSHFLDMMYVEFIKNFFLADSGELSGVRVISATVAQKRLIPTF